MLFLELERIPHPRVAHLQDAGLDEFLHQRFSAAGLTVDQENLFQSVFCGPGVVQQQPLAGLGGEAVNGDHLYPTVVGLTENPDLLFLLCQSSSQGVGCLPGDDHHRVAVIFNGVLSYNILMI